MAESYPQIDANKTVYKITFLCVFLVIVLIAGAFLVFGHNGDDNKGIDKETLKFILIDARSYWVSYPDTKCVTVDKSDIEIYKCFSPSVVDRCKDPFLYVFLKNMTIIDYKLIKVCV